VKSIIVLNFYVNQDFIALNLCQNKAIPSRNCKGKCYLKMKLNQENHKQQNLPSVLNECIQYPFILTHGFCINYLEQIISIENKFSYVLKKYAVNLLPVFHPPC
jgi:hypothetical protein